MPLVNEQTSPVNRIDSMSDEEPVDDKPPVLTLTS